MMKIFFKKLPEQMPYKNKIATILSFFSYDEGLVKVGIWTVISFIIIPLYKKLFYVSIEDQLLLLRQNFEKFNDGLTPKYNAFQLVEITQYLEKIFLASGLLWYLALTSMPIIVLALIIIRNKKNKDPPIPNSRIYSASMIFYGQSCVITFFIPNFIIWYQRIKSTNVKYVIFLFCYICFLYLSSMFFNYVAKKFMEKSPFSKIKILFILTNFIFLFSYSTLALYSRGGHQRAFAITKMKYGSKTIPFDKVGGALIVERCLNQNRALKNILDICKKDPRNTVCNLRDPKSDAYKIFLDVQSSCIEKSPDLEKSYSENIWPIEIYVEKIFL